MIIVMVPHAEEAAIERVVSEIGRMGAQAHFSRAVPHRDRGGRRRGGAGSESPGVAGWGGKSRAGDEAVQTRQSREFHEDDSVIEIGGGSVPKVKVGGPHAMCIAGPCAVENREMLYRIARHVRDGGATVSARRRV